MNLQLIDAQQQLRKIRDEMDRLNRTDSNYLKLFTDEHGLLKQESKLINDYKLKEEEERAAFFNLSSKLREAQERERIRVERTKYLQFGLSILCTSLGLLSAYFLNYFRNSNIREILEYDKEHFKTLEESVKTIMEKQEGIESNFESMMSKWNSSFKIPDESPEVLAQAELPNQIEDSPVLDDNGGLDIRKHYVNAVFISLLVLASGFFYFKNK